MKPDAGEMPPAGVPEAIGNNTTNIAANGLSASVSSNNTDPFDRLLQTFGNSYSEDPEVQCQMIHWLATALAGVKQYRPRRWGGSRHGQ